MPLAPGQHSAAARTDELEPLAAKAGSGTDLLWMALVAAVSGVMTGVLGSGFHLLLARADGVRAAFLGWARQWPTTGWLAPVLLIAVLAAFVHWMVQRFAPRAAGGVPQIDTASTEGATAPPLTVIVVALTGGILAIGSGLAVGREGTIGTMGSTIGASLAMRARLAANNQRAVRAAALGAGLGVAFNAPLGGLVYVFEGLTRRFSTEVMVSALAACASAVLVMRLIIGDAVEFLVVPLPPPTPATVAACLALGVVTGLLGAAYNRATIFWVDGFPAFHRLPGAVRAAMVGAVVGLVAWFEPLVVGDGSQLLHDALGNRLTLSFLLLAVVARWFLGPFSYAAGAPGGLFAPSMVVGAVCGVLLARLLNLVAPALALDPTILAVAGMAAFIAAVVRAPLTGIAIVLGVTGTVVPVIPMLAACFSAIVTPRLLNSAPIFTSLRERTPQTHQRTSGAAPQYSSNASD